MTEESIVSAKYQILNILSVLDDDELDSIEQWIYSHDYKKDLKQKKDLQNIQYKLEEIGKDIKKIVPFCGEMSSENIVAPNVGDQSDCNSSNTIHVDEFLYNNEEVEKLVDNKEIKKYYCVDCKSQNIDELIFISHSMSVQVLQYIFKVLLPKDLEDKKILDLGSRIGAVLFSAYYHTNSPSIMGIEINKECCEIQEKMIEQFSLDTDRLKVINSDILDKSDLVGCADIIIMNVFDFFLDNEKHKEMWYFFKKHFKKGSYVVTNRSLIDTLGPLNVYEDFIDWLSICKPFQLQNEIFFDIEDCSELFLHIVN